MKKLLMLVMAVSTLMAQDIAGHYRVSALDVQYYDIARQDTDVKVQDAYGLGVELTLLTIHAGDLFYGTHSGPYNEATLAAVGINLNVNFNEDGSATLAEGSYYPDVNEENCVSSVQILPITDDMVYSSDITNPGAFSPLPSTNMVGLPSISARAGDLAGGLSLNEALVFDYFPQGGAGYINQYGPDFTPNTGDEIAPVSIPVAVPMVGLGAGDNLHGVHGGWVNVGDLGNSLIPTSSVDPDLYAEWHAIDGPASESGLGDFIGQDEDGFDGDFDRTFGLPVLPSATYFTGNDGCSVYGTLGSTAVAGDVTSAVQGGVMAQGMGICTAAGTPQEAVSGLCFDTAQSDDFAATCEAVGASASVVGACIQLGFTAEVCASAGAMAAGGIAQACEDGVIAGAEAACDGAGGLWNTLYGGCLAQGADEATCAGAADAGVAGYGDCATWASTTYAGATCADAGTTDCAVLTSEAFSTGLCQTVGYGLVESDTCEEWATSLALSFVDNCIAGVDVATTMYVMDPSGASAPWSNFVTWHGVAASQGIAGGIADCMGLGYDYDTCYGMVMADPTIQYLLSTDDSGSEMDPSCLADGDFSDCAGRVRFNFAPTCIPEIEVRQVVIEAVLLGGECLANGDANEDGAVNVLDVVGMVQAILGNGSLSDDGACNADINSDGTLNVLDVVSVVQTILGNRATSASAVEIIKSSEGVSFIADGYVGGIQMTINHGDDFSIEMTDKAMVADYRTEGNSTTLMVVNPESDELFVADGNYTIETVVAAANGAYIDISVPTAFSVSNAYPNPFNPTTSLNINLDVASHVSVKVFNVMGQLMDVVTEGQMTEGTHAISWDASTVASGVYFINTEVGSSLSSQKVMLLK